MTDIKSAPDLKPGSVPALSRGQKSGLDLTLYGGRVLPQTFGQVVEFAQMMCKGGVAIPKHLRENPGACLSVIQRSMAWEMDPWAVATKTYEVNDILAYEAQLIAAVVRKWAPVKEKVINPVYTGEGETRQCKITLHHVETGELIEYISPMIGPDIGKVADDGSKTKSPPSNYKGIWPKNSPLWRHEPDQQLFYYSIRAMARRFFPDILLGVYDREEAYAMRDITPAAERRVDNMLNDDPPGEALEGEVQDRLGHPIVIETKAEIKTRFDESAAAKSSRVDGEAREFGQGTADAPRTSPSGVVTSRAEPKSDSALSPGADGEEEAPASTTVASSEPPHDSQTGELFDQVEETPITPELLAANMVKSIKGFTDKQMLEDYQNTNQVAINGLKGDLGKAVRKALFDRHNDLEEF